MSDDKFEDLKRRVAARREAASQNMRETFSGQMPTPAHQAPLTPLAGFDQISMQTASAIFNEPTETDPAGMQAPEAVQSTPRPAAPTGQWRCIVNSNPVTIDLVARISENGSLSGRGTILYVATNKIYEVSGQGDWTVFPPDANSPKWLFKFRLQPSNHAIFSWFASPTASPNHLQNRFVVPNNGGVVETNCERIG